jgi:bacillithiol biosynthesis cysteine-adding enzyme BshC
MEIESVHLPSGQPLAEAFARRIDPKVEAIFGGHPAETAHWQRRLERLKEHRESRVPPGQLADMLAQYNRRYNGSEAVTANIASIADGAPVIVGGQQAGLWTGPLLVIHKAVSILTAARHAAELTGETVVPVFWIAGEDHDWDEANHAFVVSQEHELTKIAIERPAGARSSVSRTRLTQEALQTALESLTSALQDTEFKPALIDALTAFAAKSATLSDLFAYVMGWLFGDQGLVLMDADDPQLRRLESPMFRRMVEHSGALEQAYKRGAAAVTEQGFPLQAEVAEGCANLFLFHEADEASGETEAGRTLLFNRSGRFENRRRTISLSAESLLTIADETPERLSNNVLTRPLMQDYVLPVLGAVLGPGEIAYWAITGEAFRVLGMEMPIIVPRMSFTLIEGTIAKHMMKYGLSLEAVAFRFKERKEAWLKEQDDLDIEGRFAEVKRKFGELYDPLLGLASSVQAGLAKLGETNKQKIVEQIEFLQARTLDAHAKQFEAAIRQLDRIALALSPGGKPQERVVNALIYWNRYGRSWLDRLLEAPFDPHGGHRVIYL